MRQFQLRATFSAIAIVMAVSNPLAAQENAPLLRYGFQAGKQYAFEVKIQAETENYDEIRSGVLNYNVTSAKDAQFVVRPSGNLSVQMKQRPDTTGMPRGFPPFGPFGPMGMGPMGIMGMGGPEGITINRQGEKITSRELTSLPYLLGEMEMLVFEDFPAEAKSNWEKQRDVAVVERDSNSPFPRFRFGPMRDTDGKHTTAKEQINYAVVKRDKDAVEISKKYSLLTSPEADKPSRFEMTGDGLFTFDLKEGVIKSFSMKYECRMNETNVIKKIPITLTYNLLTAEEMAQRQKKAEEARAASEKANAPKDFQLGERERLLKELRSTDTRTIRTAADRLAKTPVDDQPADIARALARLLGHSDGWVQKSAANALVVWAAPEAEIALIKASQSDDVFVRGPVLEALGKLKTTKAAEAVAAQMYQQNSRHDVSKSLKAMGPIAEDATIALLKDRDEWVRAEACSVLEEIGGAKSLKALRNFTPRSRGFEENNSKKAISAIELRLESQPEVETQIADSKAKSDSSSLSPSGSSISMRTWRDASGTFSIEAVMLAQEDGKVVLQKKDGKTIRVAIEKLSPADKEYVAKNADKLKSKAENPFE